MDAQELFDNVLGESTADEMSRDYAARALSEIDALHDGEVLDLLITHYNYGVKAIRALKNPYTTLWDEMMREFGNPMLINFYADQIREHLVEPQDGDHADSDIILAALKAFDSFTSGLSVRDAALGLDDGTEQRFVYYAMNAAASFYALIDDLHSAAHSYPTPQLLAEHLLTRKDNMAQIVASMLSLRNELLNANLSDAEIVADWMFTTFNILPL